MIGMPMHKTAIYAWNKIAEGEDSTWVAQARKEGIPDAVIERTSKAGLQYPLAFARGLHHKQIGAGEGEFEEEARHLEQQYHVYQAEFNGTTPDQMESLDEIRSVATRVEEELALKRGKNPVFDPMDLAKRQRVVRTEGGDIYEVYLMDKFSSREKLSRVIGSENPCILNQNNWIQYGGIFLIFLKNGKQWVLMAPHHKSYSAFTTYDNKSLANSPCEKALAISMSYDLADAWQSDFIPSFDACTDHKTAEMIKKLVEKSPQIPYEAVQVFESRYLFKRSKPDRVIQLLMTNRNQVTNPIDIKALDDAWALIKAGKFAWSEAIDGIVREEKRYQPEMQWTFNPAISKKENEINLSHKIIENRSVMQKLADVAISAYRLAIETETAQFKGRISSFKNQHGREPSPDEKLDMGKSLAALSAYIDSPDTLLKMEESLRFCTPAKYEELIESLLNMGKEEMATMLKSLYLKKVASGIARHTQSDPKIIATGDHGLIRSYYTNVITAATPFMRHAGTIWKDLESFIVDDFIAGADRREIRRLLSTYLARVAEPQQRMEIMVGALKNATSRLPQDQQERTVSDFVSMLPPIEQNATTTA
jgi:hypothetical protein